MDLGEQMSNLRGNLTGVNGLLLAIIDQALRDYERGGVHRPSAVLYFQSNLYRHHVTALGLPADILPTILQDDRERGPGACSGGNGGRVAMAGPGVKLNNLSVSVGGKV